VNPDPALRALDIDLPASPAALARLGAVMADEDASVAQLAAVVESDMALASAVVRTVNSAMFGLLRRVETVTEAVQYLGLREVAAITFEMGLRTRFPADPLLDALWDAARVRGLLMGRVAARLGLHAWRAHSAGLFAQTGQAVLFLHDRASFAALEAGWPPGTPAHVQAQDEARSFGVDHAVLGAALCRAWGLAADVADCVRERPFESRWTARPQSVRELLCVGAVVDEACAEGASLTADRVAPLAGLAASALTSALAQVRAQLNEGGGEASA